MAFNTSFGRTEGWHETDKFQSQLRTKPQSGDFFARLTQSGQEVLSGGNTAALNEVLRQFNEEKSRYQEPPLRIQLREHQTEAGFQRREQFQDTLVPDHRLPPQGNLGDQLKSQLVELGNFVGSLQLRAEKRSNGERSPFDCLAGDGDDHAAGSSPADRCEAKEGSPASYHSPGSGGGDREELEVLRLQIAALAQSLAGLGACVVNWSAFLTNPRRQQLQSMVLRYTEPCEHLSAELQDIPAV
ncbi:unnamed protein product [Durusdinium trenchii]|uniref:Uncharacterized protein n=1 Tax=Durusdinium trenchii TaxID=1381693 RepID=A0ABP0RYE9_9DINO